MIRSRSIVTTSNARSPGWSARPRPVTVMVAPASGVVCAVTTEGAKPNARQAKRLDGRAETVMTVEIPPDLAAAPARAGASHGSLAWFERDSRF